MAKKAPWWWPLKMDSGWRKNIRTKHPETKSWPDEVVDEYFGHEDFDFAVSWDSLEEARHHYDELADAFLRIVEASNLAPEDFK